MYAFIGKKYHSIFKTEDIVQENLKYTSAFSFQRQSFTPKQILSIYVQELYLLGKR